MIQFGRIQKVQVFTNPGVLAWHCGFPDGANNFNAAGGLSMDGQSAADDSGAVTHNAEPQPLSFASFFAKTEAVVTDC